MPEMNKRTILLCVILGLSLTSCKDNSAQEASRSVRSTSIVPYSERDDFTKTETIRDSLIESSEGADSSNGNYKANDSLEHDFELVFSDNFVKVDYAKSSVNIYKARYSTLSNSWGDDWFTYGYGEINDWCRGIPLSVNGVDNCVPNQNVSRKNVESVQVVSLSEINGYEEIATRLGIKEDSKVLCWFYTVYDFPQEYSDLPFFRAPIDLSTIKYAHISAQFVDDLPVYGNDNGIGYGYCTYEWDGVIEPSRIADSGIMDSKRINPDQTCILCLERGRFDITDTLQSSVQVVDPENCINGIKDALMYDPYSSTDSDLRHIWGTTVEIYCMELTYVVLDSSPRNSNESEESRKLHELFLVPVWEVYYYISNPKDEQVFFDGTVMVNAVTGESLYSDSYGPEENTLLYPDLLQVG